MATKPTATPQIDCNRTSAAEREADSLAHIRVDTLKGQSCDLEQRAAVLEAEERRLKGEMTFKVSEARAMLRDHLARA